MNWVIIKHTYLAQNNFLSKSCKSAKMVPENRGKHVYTRTQIELEACDRTISVVSPAQTKKEEKE